MRRALFISLPLLCIATLCAEPAKLKQATGSVIRGKGRIQTGSSSRIEFELPYLAIVRIGSNANFNFSPDWREMTLDSGAMLFSAPKDAGAFTLHAAGITTQMAGRGTLQLSNVVGRVKVMALDGKVVASLAAKPSEPKKLRFGQMLDVPAGATAMPPVVAFKMATVLKTSILFNMGPFPGKAAIERNATKQAPPRPFVTGGFDPDWGSGSMAQVGPTITAAMIARMEAGSALQVPVLPPDAIPTQAQLRAFESAGVEIPASNRRAIERRGLEITGGRIRPAPKPPPTPPAATPRPTLPPRPNPLPITPRPTPRPPIAVP